MKVLFRSWSTDSEELRTRSVGSLSWKPCRTQRWKRKSGTRTETRGKNYTSLYCVHLTVLFIKTNKSSLLTINILHWYSAVIRLLFFKELSIYQIIKFKIFHVSTGEWGELLRRGDWLWLVESCTNVIKIVQNWSCVLFCTPYLCDVFLKLFSI